MATYADWTDVSELWEEASSVESNTSTQAAILAQASAVVDAFLSPVMQTPIEQEGGAYPAVVVLATAAISAHLVARRRQIGDADQWIAEYGGRTYYGTRFLHEALSLYLQPLYEARAALPDQVTPGETVLPRLAETFTTTNGKVRVRYSGGRFSLEKETVYVVTITSAAGTVAGNDLEVSIVRDNDETVATLTITSTGWYPIEGGLQIAFSDADSAPVWEQDDYATITCTPVSADIVGGSLRSVDLPLG